MRTAGVRCRGIDEAGAAPAFNEAGAAPAFNERTAPVGPAPSCVLGGTGCAQPGNRVSPAEERADPHFQKGFPLPAPLGWGGLSSWRSPRWEPAMRNLFSPMC